MRAVARPGRHLQRVDVLQDGQGGGRGHRQAQLLRTCSGGLVYCGGAPCDALQPAGLSVSPAGC
jgi:hypothetical protein